MRRKSHFKLAMFFVLEVFEQMPSILADTIADAPLWCSLLGCLDCFMDESELLTGADVQVSWQAGAGRLRRSMLVEH